MRINNTELRIIKGDITDFDTDVIGPERFSI